MGPALFHYTSHLPLIVVYLLAMLACVYFKIKWQTLAGFCLLLLSIILFPLLSNTVLAEATEGQRSLIFSALEAAGIVLIVYGLFQTGKESRYD
jgi:phosphoglycerol transferase MdoB-like AlkP superfamily enzyme